MGTSEKVHLGVQDKHAQINIMRNSGWLVGPYSLMCPKTQDKHMTAINNNIHWLRKCDSCLVLCHIMGTLMNMTVGWLQSGKYHLLNQSCIHC